MKIFAYHLAMHFLSKLLPARDLMVYMIKKWDIIYLDEFWPDHNEKSEI